MKIEINTTEFSNEFLAAMVRWCAREAGAKIGAYRFQFRTTSQRTRREWSGRVYYLRRLISCCTPTSDRKDQYPIVARRYTPRWVAEPKGLTHPDRLELILHIASHEISHGLYYSMGSDLCRNEAVVDHQAWLVTNQFRSNREALVKEWEYKEVQHVALAATIPKTDPRTTAAAKREANARSKLAEWERKQAMAKTKVKRWAAKVRYYDRKKEGIDDG